MLGPRAYQGKGEGGDRRAVGSGGGEAAREDRGLGGDWGRRC